MVDVDVDGTVDVEFIVDGVDVGADFESMMRNRRGEENNAKKKATNLYY